MKENNPNRLGIKGGVLLPLSLMLGVLAFLTMAASSIYVSSLERQTLNEISDRKAESTARSALEITNALIHGHILVQDSITQEWDFKKDSKKPLNNTFNSFVLFQRPNSKWEDEIPHWAGKAIKRHPQILAGFNWGSYPNQNSIDTTLSNQQSIPGNSLPKAKLPTLVYKLSNGVPVVTLTTSRAYGSEIEVNLEAVPFPKQIKARVGSFCRDYDPAALAIRYRNLTGKEPNATEIPSYLAANRFPVKPNDISILEQNLIQKFGNNFKIIEARLKNDVAANDLVRELYNIYLDQDPTDEEQSYLLNLLKNRAMSFSQVQTAMKTAPVFRFTNLKNDSFFYTRDENAARLAGFKYEKIEFYVFGDVSLPSFAPPSEMAPLYSCYHSGKDIYFISLRNDCVHPLLAASRRVSTLGYVYTKPNSWFTLPIYEYAKTGTTTALLTTTAVTAPNGYASVPSSTSGERELAYVSNNDNQLAAVVALYRTYFSNQQNEESYFTNAIFSRARELDPSFKNNEALEWLGQRLQSYKSYHDTEGCGKPNPPAPKCYLSGPSQVPANTPAEIELNTYGEFTSVKWDNIEVSDSDDRSVIGPLAIIEKTTPPLKIPPKSFTTASGIIRTSATISLQYNGKTLSTSCSLPSKSVDFRVIPNFPKLSNEYVVNRKAASLGYQPAFSLSYSTQGFTNPVCVIVNQDRSFISNALTQPSGTVLINSGIDKDTEYRIFCSDKDHTQASSKVIAKIFPVPNCCLSGYSLTTAGYGASMTLSGNNYADRAKWDNYDYYYLPATQHKFGGPTSAMIYGPGGSNSCSTNISVMPVPPPYCTGTGVKRICYPAPIPPPSNYGTWCSNTVVVQKTCQELGNCPQKTCQELGNCPVTKQSCKIEIVHPGKDYTCNPQKMALFEVFIPRTNKVPVLSILYGKKRSTTYGKCITPQPAPAPTQFKHSDGLTYDLSDGSGWGSKDCKVSIDYQSPLILNLEDQEIQVTSPKNGVEFDLTGDSDPEIYSWPQTPQSSVFLAYDKNEDGIIKDIHELFGNNTLGPDSNKSTNGFEALKKYDDNQDGVIDEKDSIYRKLRVWFPYTKNGKPIIPSVLKTLTEVKIKSINLNYKNRTNRMDYYGNATRQQSTVEMADKSKRKLVDLWMVPY